MARYALGFGLLCGVLLSGCNNSAPPKKPPQPASPEVSITTASWEQIQKNIAEKHRGKIVVVDVWSVWCEPCMKELPELASLQAKHPDDLACLTLNIDNEGDESDLKKAQGVLESKKIVLENYFCSVSSDEFYEQTENFGVPIVEVYDRQGELRQRFGPDYNDGEFSYHEHIVPLVEKLLAEPQ